MESIIEQRKIEHKKQNIKSGIVLATIIVLGCLMNFILNLSCRDIVLVFGFPFLYGIIGIIQNKQDEIRMNQGE